MEMGSHGMELSELACRSLGCDSGVPGWLRPGSFPACSSAAVLSRAPCSWGLTLCALKDGGPLLLAGDGG